MMATMPPRLRERGSAMLLTLVVIVSLLAGAAILVNLQLGSTHATDLTKTGNLSLYCAEAGLVSARATVAANYNSWNASLTSTTEPSWLSGINHDLDGDGVADFMITLHDNDDELPPAVNDLTKDNDLKVFIVSTCLKYPDVPKTVEELVEFSGGGTCYQSQVGGCGGNGNGN